MKKSSAKRLSRSNGIALARWHRRFGIAAALVVVWLALTGVLLGHTDDFGLDKRYLSTAWLLDWYGIPVPPVVGYQAGEDWLLQAGERLYFNDNPLPGEFGRFAGIAAFGGHLIAAAGMQLLVLTHSGEVVEVLGQAHGVPGTLQAIGVRKGRLVVRTERGYYAAGEDLLTWQRLPSLDLAWSQPREAPTALHRRVARDYRTRLLTFERLVLDLHSGRLLGRFGVLAFDVAAVAFMVLAATGIWLWLQGRSRK